MSNLLKGELYGEQVFFGKTAKAPGGLASTKERLSQVPSKKTVYITNTKGNNLKGVALPIESARYLVNLSGNQFRYSTEDEIPFCPKEEIIPYDSGKKIEAQERANVEMTGSDVQELVDQGIDPLEGVVSYKEMRSIAKENGINTFKTKKKELAKILRDKKLIQ